jgi:hypothetical protein
MKYPLLFCVSLCFSVLSYAQNEKFNNNATIKSAPLQKYDNNGNKLKVILMKDSLFVSDKDQLVPVAGIKALDSLLKKLPNPETLLIEFESTNAQSEKIRSVDEILRQCRCHITRKSISFNKQ